MRCEYCGHNPSGWPTALVRVGTIGAILLAYQITLSLVVERYDFDELRNILLLVANIILVLGGKEGIAQLRRSLTHSD